MKSTLARTDDGTITIGITIPQALVKKVTEDIVEKTVSSANIPGFRKGKAPKKLVEDKISKDKVREEALRELLPQAYSEAVKEHDIKPIMNPRVHIEALTDDKDWQITASTCEAPKVELNGYKEAVKKITAKSKIIIPGKEKQDPSLDEIIGELQKSVKVNISKIIVEQEVERLLAQMLDEIKRLGLTLDQYLASTKKTVEDIKKDFEEKATRDVSLEFTLQKIAEEEKITVEDTEIQEAINKAKDEAEKKNLESNRYLLASIIRQQKTLDFLKNL